MMKADEPAVPEGREPAAVTGQPSDEELALIYHDCCRGCEFMDQGGFEDAARAVLARWGRPAPAPPADGEVAELVPWLQEEADDYECIGCEDSAAKCDRAAELLERLASPACVVLKPSPELIEAFQDALPGRIEPLLEERHPAPVPVGERPWEREGWCDAERRCWWGTPGFINSYTVAQSAQWRLSTPDDRFGSELLCLPAHALPQPEVGE